MPLWLWIILAIFGVLIYINIVDVLLKAMDKNDFPKDEGDRLFCSIVWPLGAPITLIVLLTKYIIDADRSFLRKFLNNLLFMHKIPGYFKGLKEKRHEKKEQKLLEAHEANPLQKELDRYAELKNIIPNLQEELYALEVKLEVENYREPDKVRMAEK